MSKEQYDLVFKGELVKGVELERARHNLGSLFKLDGPKLNALFSGKNITIKKKLDFDTASKYRIAIKKAGAIVELVEIKMTTSTPPKGKAVFAVSNSPSESNEEKKTSHDGSSDIRPGGKPNSTFPSEQSNEKETPNSQFSLAPIGADILSSRELRPEPEVYIDVSSLSLKTADGPLVDENEIKKEAVQTVKIDDSISVLDTQGYLVDDDERQSVNPINVDVSSISMAEPGVRLVEAIEEPRVEIDISRLSIKSH